MHPSLTPPMPAAALPSTAAGCRAQLALLHGQIALLRTQSAAADMRRQAEHRGLNAHAFEEARAALHQKRQAAANLVAHLKALEAGHPREGFKDALIELVRTQFDAGTWQGLINQARARHATQEEKSHG